MGKYIQKKMIDMNRQEFFDADSADFFIFNKKITDLLKKDSALLI